jgi:hypothetical protein
VFAKNMMKMTTLLVRGVTVLHLLFKFHTTSLKVTL